MKKIYLTIALVFLSFGLSACVSETITVGKCLVLDNTTKHC